MCDTSKSLLAQFKGFLVALDGVRYFFSKRLDLDTFNLDMIPWFAKMSWKHLNQKKREKIVKNLDFFWEFGCLYPKYKFIRILVNFTSDWSFDLNINREGYKEKAFLNSISSIDSKLWLFCFFLS